MSLVLKSKLTPLMGTLVISHQVNTPPGPSAALGALDLLRRPLSVKLMKLVAPIVGYPLKGQGSLGVLRELWGLSGGSLGKSQEEIVLEFPMSDCLLHGGTL